jgi:cell division protein FtsQ
MSAMLRLLAWILAVALVALPVVAVVNGWVGGAQWPLRTLRVQGDLHQVDQARLRATVLPYAKQGFFAVELDRIQAAVGALPWVERAEVRKHWPDVLEVRISEHRPYARWGSDRLLSEHGKLFSAKGVQVRAGLPQLDGPDTQVAEVVALYNQARERLANAGGDKTLIVGLDIGTSKVVAMVGEYAPGEPIEIIGIGSQPSAASRAWWWTSSPPCSRSSARWRRPS